MSINALSTGAAGLHQALRRFDASAATVAAASTHIPGALAPPAAAQPGDPAAPAPGAQPDPAQVDPGAALLDGQIGVLMAPHAVRANLATIATAHALYADVIGLLGRRET